MELELLGVKINGGQFWVILNSTILGKSILQYDVPLIVLDSFMY